MKITRRDGISRIKIQHNKKLFWMIIILLIAFVILVYSITQDYGKKTYYFLKDNECIKAREYPDRITFSHYERLTDCENMIIRCVPATCCHPTECVPAEQAPDCDGVMCTQECRPGTLDCGQGICEFIGGECVAVMK